MIRIIKSLRMILKFALSGSASLNHSCDFFLSSVQWSVTILGQTSSEYISNLSEKRRRILLFQLYLTHQWWKSGESRLVRNFLIKSEVLCVSYISQNDTNSLGGRLSSKEIYCWAVLSSAYKYTHSSVWNSSQRPVHMLCCLHLPIMLPW